MIKKSLIFLFAFALVTGTMFSTNVAEASKSVSQLEKEIKTLKATNAKQKKQITSKDKQIKSQKSEISKKNKKISDLNKKLTYTVNPLKTKVAYQGNVLTGNYQLENTSVPAIIDYKGIKYAPVNMIGELLSSKSTYNKSLDTVFFGSTPNGSYMSDILKPYYSSRDVSVNEEMTMGGVNYNKGYSMSFYRDDSYSINLGGRYSNITGYLGMDDNSNSHYSGEIQIYGDDKLLGTYNLNTGGLPLTVNVDVSGVKKLEVYHASGGVGITVDFANVVIK